MSKKLATQFGYSLFNEPLSQNLKNKYSFLESNFIKLTEDYDDGCFYMDCKTTKGNQIEIFKKYSVKPKNFQHKVISKLKTCSDGIVLHHHILDIKDDYFKRLVKMSKKNIYIKRTNRKNQLASWAIALHENNWVNFGAPADFQIQSEIIIESEITNFYKKIKEADLIADFNQFETVYYDENEILDLGIRKMSTSSFDRLCISDQIKIVETLGNKNA